jgi:multimeric flavodoxin WrbA
MKVLALNSSPRIGGQSKTELLLSHLVAGMRDAGAEVEVVELR